MGAPLRHGTVTIGWHLLKQIEHGNSESKLIVVRLHKVVRWRLQIAATRGPSARFYVCPPPLSPFALKSIPFSTGHGTQTTEAKNKYLLVVFVSVLDTYQKSPQSV